MQGRCFHSVECDGGLGIPLEGEERQRLEQACAGARTLATRAVDHKGHVPARGGEQVGNERLVIVLYRAQNEAFVVNIHKNTPLKIPQSYKKRAIEQKKSANRL